MMPHTPLSLLWVADATSPAPASLAANLESIPHVQLTRVTQLPADPGNHDVVISRGGGGGPDPEGFVRNGGGWLALADASPDPLHQLPAGRPVDPDHDYVRQDIPATEMTPAVTIARHRAEGEIVCITPAMAEREAHAFHRNLADHLLLGEPIGAPLADSVKVVAIPEAAARSMARGGTREVIDGE